MGAGSEGWVPGSAGASPVGGAKDGSAGAGFGSFGLSLIVLFTPHQDRWNDAVDVFQSFYSGLQSRDIIGLSLNHFSQSGDCGSFKDGLEEFKTPRIHQRLELLDFLPGEPQGVRPLDLADSFEGLECREQWLRGFGCRVVP